MVLRHIFVFGGLMSDSKRKTILEILKHLPSELQGLADELPPAHLLACNLYLEGHSMLMACSKAGLIDPHSPLSSQRNKASSIMNCGQAKEYIAGVKNYSCSATVMDLHEIDIRLSQIARTDANEILGYTSEPILEYSEELGKEIVIGYRTRPYLNPIETLDERQRAAIKGIKQTKFGLEVDLHDPMKAMDMLIKRKGGYTENVNTKVETAQVKAFIPDNGRGPMAGSVESED